MVLVAVGVLVFVGVDVGVLVGEGVGVNVGVAVKAVGVGVIVGVDAAATVRQASAPTVVNNVRPTRPRRRMAISNPTARRKDTSFETEAACLTAGDEKVLCVAEGVVAIVGEATPSVG